MKQGQAEPRPCKLCGETKRLCQSHIIPEFVYKPLYDADHRFIEVTDAKAGRVRRTQIGHKQHLLCTDCEAHLNTFEQHSLRLFRDPLPALSLFRKRIREYPTLDYAKLKLFILSILWRASVSTHPAYKLVKLGPHEEIIRKAILEADPGNTSFYPVSICVVNMDGQQFVDFMVEPTYRKGDGGRYYRLSLSGFFIEVFVASHPAKDVVVRGAIAPDRPITTIDLDFNEIACYCQAWNTVGETTKNVEV